MTSYKSGEYVWKRGDLALPVRVAAGALALFRGNPDAFRGLAPIAIVPRGDVAFPSLAALHAPATAHALCICDAELEEVQSNTVAVAKAPQAEERIIDMAESLSAVTLDTRLARALLLLQSPQLGRRAGAGQPGSGEMEVKCRQELLAAVAGGRRETVSTILSDWTERRIVQTRYARIWLLDPEELRALAKLPASVE